eukprot:scaffold12145_cov139-Amphora_coffeaeformis.AAC.2
MLPSFATGIDTIGRQVAYLFQKRHCILVGDIEKDDGSKAKDGNKTGWICGRFIRGRFQFDYQ